MEILMSNPSSGPPSSVLWTGRPWIVPAAVARAIVVLVVGVLLVWVEYFTGTASETFFGLSIVLWTVLVFFLVWLVGLIGLLIERATNRYTLKNDSLEIQTGIATSRTVVLVASGFSDLEVIRGIAGRIFGYGDIVIRMQSERDSQKVMAKVQDPLKVGEQIRYVMGRPVVRVESQLQPPSQTKP
jgi:uncharacterized membrane protein YdbT with pleckstrin-like domain